MDPKFLPNDRKLFDYWYYYSIGAISFILFAFFVEFDAMFISHLGGYNEKVIKHCFSTIINFDSMRF